MVSWALLDHMVMLTDVPGSITYDASVFPNGILPLAKKAIGLGMQWSMYTDEGEYACDTRTAAQGLRPGSRGYESQDALQLGKSESKFGLVKYRP